MSNSGLLHEYITRDELAQQLDLSTRTIIRYSKRPNGLPFLKIGGKVRYRLQSVRTWLDAQEYHPNPVRQGRGAR